jgi:hypothetical protein
MDMQREVVVVPVCDVERAPPHDWWDWYAAYMDARERGASPEEAAAAAAGYMAEVKGVAVARA